MMAFILWLTVALFAAPVHAQVSTQLTQSEVAAITVLLDKMEADGQFTDDNPRPTSAQAYFDAIVEGLKTDYLRQAIDVDAEAMREAYREATEAQRRAAETALGRGRRP